MSDLDIARVVLEQFKQYGEKIFKQSKNRTVLILHIYHDFSGDVEDQDKKEYFSFTSLNGLYNELQKRV